LHLEAVEYSPTGRSLVVAGSRLTGNIWDGQLLVFAGPAVGEVGSGPLKTTATAKVSLDGGCADVKWIDERRLVSGCDTGAVSVWDWRGDGTLEQTGEFLEHDDMINGLAVSRNSVLSVSEDGSARVWDITEEGQARAMATSVLQAHAKTVLGGSFLDTEGNAAVTVSRDSTVCLWDTRGKSQPTACKRLDAYATSVAWHPAHEHHVVLGTVTGGVSVLDLRATGEALLSIGEQSSHTSAVCGLAINQKGDVACASDDLSVSVINLGSSKRTHHAEKHTDFARGVSWNPEDDRQFKSVGWDSQALDHVVSA